MSTAPLNETRLALDAAPTRIFGSVVFVPARPSPRNTCTVFALATVTGWSDVMFSVVVPPLLPAGVSTVRKPRPPLLATFTVPMVSETVTALVLLLPSNWNSPPLIARILFVGPRRAVTPLLPSDWSSMRMPPLLTLIWAKFTVPVPEMLTVPWLTDNAVDAVLAPVRVIVPVPTLAMLTLPVPLGTTVETLVAAKTPPNVKSVFRCPIWSVSMSLFGPLPITWPLPVSSPIVSTANTPVELLLLPVCSDRLLPSCRLIAVRSGIRLEPLRRSWNPLNCVTKLFVPVGGPPSTAMVELEAPVLWAIPPDDTTPCLDCPSRT